MQLKRYSKVEITSKPDDGAVWINVALTCESKGQTISLSVPASGPLDYLAQAFSELGHRFALMARPIPKAERDAVLAGQTELPTEPFKGGKFEHELGTGYEPGSGSSVDAPTC